MSYTILLAPGFSNDVADLFESAHTRIYEVR